MTTSDTGVLAAPLQPAPSTSIRGHWSALPVLLAGAFMVVLDFFIVNVALPAMVSDLGAGESSLEWVVAGYGLAFAAFLITAGRLGDAVGRRRVYALGLGVFTLTSLACGLAPSPTALVVARFAQGAAAAVMMPQVLSTIAVTYQGPDHARALSLYGIVLGLAAIGGQLIGGVLVETDVLGLGWRGCFLINVPIGLTALALTARTVPESRAPRRPRIDLASSLVLAVGLVAILVPLIQGREHGWPLWTWVSLAAAPVILGGFLAWQARLARRGADALLDLALFRERAFSAGLVAQLGLASVQAAFFVYLALYLQQGRGLNALEAGLVFTILAAAYVVASGPAPKLTAQYGRAVVASGGFALAGGFAALAGAVGEIGVGGSLLALVPGLLAVGAGIGLCFTPIQQTVLGDIGPARAGTASGMLSTTQQLGFALGVAITGIVYFGSADTEVAHAFQLSLIQMAVFAAEIVVMTRLLPRPARRARAAAVAEATA
jgi:EmrB/QacA subfamily drug resistance transporter